MIADPLTPKALSCLDLLNYGLLHLHLFSPFFLLLVDLVRLLHQRVSHLDIRSHDYLKCFLDQLVAHDEVQVLFA